MSKITRIVKNGDYKGPGLGREFEMRLVCRTGGVPGAFNQEEDFAELIRRALSQYFVSVEWTEEFGSLGANVLDGTVAPTGGANVVTEDAFNKKEDERVSKVIQDASNNTGLETIVGKVPNRISRSGDEILFYFTDGTIGRFYHEQDCCEDVWIEDVSGDWDDLIGVPLLVAEERLGTSGWADDDEYTHETWTFYTFRSIRGSVDVRWCGQSNGYYSESVDFELFKKE